MVVFFFIVIMSVGKDDADKGGGKQCGLKNSPEKQSDLLFR